MRKALLDTSFIIAFLFSEDVFHEKAVKRVKLISDRTAFYTIPLVVQESATVLCRRCREKNINHKSALEVFKNFVKTLSVIEFPLSHERVIKEMIERSCELSFVDVVLLHTAKKLGAEILTFDRKLLEGGQR